MFITVEIGCSVLAEIGHSQMRNRPVGPATISARGIYSTYAAWLNVGTAINGLGIMAFGHKIDGQLPKWQPWTFERILAIVGSIAGVVGLLFAYIKIDKLAVDTQALVLIYELAIICVCLLVYIYVISWKKLHRYAQATFYTHFINHSVRDQIAKMEEGQEVELAELLQNIVDAVANCFSILTARRCRCALKEIKSDGTVATVVRDRVTDTQSPDAAGHVHSMADNTDFSDLWYGRHGRPRYFLGQDLVALWRAGQYRNSSFNVHGNPKTWSFAGFTFVSVWPLPYKSTLVLPIRFIPPECKWPFLDDSNYKQIPEKSRPFVFGFLCIDCRSRNTFDDIFAPELGGCFADAIFTLLYSARKNAGDRLPFSDQNRSIVGAPPALPAPQSMVVSAKAKQRRRRSKQKGGDTEEHSDAAK